MIRAVGQFQRRSAVAVDTGVKFLRRAQHVEERVRKKPAPEEASSRIAI